MVPIYRGMLILLLKVFALATKITKREMKELDEKESHFVHGIKKTFRRTTANSTAYLKQLLMGGDSEISAAVSKLEQLVREESSMMQAVVGRKTTEIKSIALEIRGFNVEMSEAMYKLGATSSGVDLKVTQVLDRLDDFEAKAEARFERTYTQLEIVKDAMVLVSGSVQSLLTAKDSYVSEREDKGDKAAAKQNPLSQTTQSAPSKETRKHTPLAVLKSQWGATKLDPANTAVLNSIKPLGDTANWILEEPSMERWMQGELGTVLLTGEAGFGKTYLAGKVVRELVGRYRSGVINTARSVASFFCRKDSAELGSVDCIIRSLAYQVACQDRLFAEHIADLFASSRLTMSGGSLTVHAEKKQELGSLTEVWNSFDGDGPITASHPHSDLRAISALNAAEEADHESTGIAATGEQASELTEFVDQGSEATREERDTEDPRILDEIGRMPEQKDVEKISVMWKTLFVEYYRNSPGSSAFFVIDALDECPEPGARALLAALREEDRFESRSRTGFQVLVVMKPDMADILDWGGTKDAGSSSLLVQTDARKNLEDLESFVHHRLKIDWAARLVSPTLFNDSKSQIVHHSEGSFLKASLMIDEITSLSRESAIRKKLQALPSTLEEATMLVISRLERQFDEDEINDLHVSTCP